MSRSSSLGRMVSSLRPGILFGHALLDGVDPQILIGGAQRAGDNGEIAFAVQQARGFIGERVADAFGRGLVDEEIAGVRFGVGVPCHHADAALAGFAEHGGDAGGIFYAHGDGIHAARDPALDDFVLLGGVQAGGAVPDQIDAEFLGGFFRAHAATDEVGVAFRLWHHSDHWAMRLWHAERRPQHRAGGTRANAPARHWWRRRSAIRPAPRRRGLPVENSS